MPKNSTKRVNFAHINSKDIVMTIDRLTTLAFSMYSNKGAYALLLGSGISRSAHIPTGWEVETRLIEQLAASCREDIKTDAHQWFKSKYGKEASYSFLLGGLVNTSTERVQLMKQFFEPTEDEKELGWKQPTKAHLAIAKLAKAGYVRVILTTNFDRLLEQAFQAEGITPQVISFEAAISQTTPLVHCQIPTIVKINGDYIDCQFRNTSEELDEYPPIMKQYLRRIFEDYGLVTCGWSGEWDKGLIEIMIEAAVSRYNSFFATVGAAKETMQDLSRSRHGELLPINSADEMFSELWEQVFALNENQVNRNMGHDIMIAKCKKYLSSNQYDIQYSDLIENLGNEAYNVINAHAKYDIGLTRDTFSKYLEIHLNAIKPLLDIAILAVRWGKWYHIKPFGELLVKLCTKPFKNGEVTREGTQYLHSLAPMLLLNAIGIACVKYNKFRELDSILKLSVPAPNFMTPSYREPLLSLLGSTHWSYETWNQLIGQNYYYPISLFILNTLRSEFKDYFIVDSEYENTYYIWERLKSLVYGYNKCYILREFEIPLGQFVRSEREYEFRGMGKEPYTIFWNSADSLKNEWPPIKQGMFGGRYENFKELNEQASAFIKQYAHY